MKTYDAMRTNRNYVVDSPDCHNEIEIEVEDSDYIWLTKEDLEKMLALYETHPYSTKGKD